MDRQELENVIRAHPIFRDYTLAQRAAAVKGQPAPGIDPGRFKRDQVAFVSFLCEKLGAEDLLEHVLSGTKREKKDGMFSSTLERNPYTKYTSTFDGVAFIAACQACIIHFDPNRPENSFLAYFQKVYRQHLGKAQQEEISLCGGKAFARIPKDAVSKLRKVSRYIQEKFPQYTADTLPQQLYTQLAQATGLREQQVHETLRLIWMVNVIPLDAPSDGEDSPSPSLEIADPTPQELAENLERHLAVFAFLKELSKLEIHDYNQMFFSNLLLHPLHPQAGVACSVPGGEDYAKILLEQQETLYASVFHLEYLQFVGWQKDGADADPADMQVLCFGVALRELLDKTIAAYRKLSEPAVSYRRKKHFLPLLKEAAKVAFDGS